MDDFMKMMSNPSLIIQNRLSLEAEAQIAKNRLFLTSIIKCIELCGRQGIGLRGHRDDAESESLNQGNFKALLNLRVDAGDNELRDHLKSCDRNATYISKTSQNELLQCIKTYIQEVIFKEVKDGGGFFGIGADEVTDTANWEQLGLVGRYLHDGEPIERLVEYIECESCTGEAICNAIVHALTNLQLDLKMCRAQLMMGLRQRELEQCIVSAGEGRGVNQGECESDSESTVGTDDDSDSDGDDYEDGEEESIEAEDVELFEPESPKLKAAKKKIKPLCETRWVKRHSAFQDFEALYEPLMLCLETIALGNSRKKWDAKSKTEAQGLFHQIKNPVFIAAFYTARHLFGFTVGLSRSLQGSTLKVIEAYRHINVVKDQLADIRKNAKTVFAHSVYEKSQKMAKKALLKIAIPRTCGRQTLRNNTNAKTAVAYFRRTIFLPFLDNLQQQMNTRFNALSEAALLGLLLIPSNLQKLDKCSQEKLIQHYSPDLPSPSSTSQELELWKRFWTNSAEKPATLQETLKACTSSVYPNTHTILRLLLIAPVTSATVERSNSSLRFVKNVYRSTMREESLNALLLLFIHKDIALDYAAIVDGYAKRNQRRMTFINPLQ
ncbi:52 kDa repressor of the inhibitor of the protein kinase-like [Montipora foliosa]|uniref:52 kDa repressor of the inhibitor of the protein kinase-like n=1 Tax=Montipora foliosa TaxID=591990 RepID=UPI0035F1BF06